MKTTFRCVALVIVFFVACAGGRAAGVPGVEITVKQSTGSKTIKQVKTDASGNFVIGALPGGGYTLEFRAKNSPELMKKQVSITVKGAKKSGSLEHVKGEQLVAGAALKLEVASGANLTGQISSGPKMIWIPASLESHRSGRWVEEDSAEAKLSKTRGAMSKQTLHRMQEKSYNTQGGKGP
ncbi:MAG TPA: carboxypeptidase-like regulatory domain-containing protein [Chthoniobacterales bacterium]|nr:carboxypeptidase-like regulatory domain-containing protein [Chthoniobacterales bacterium]